MPLILVTDAQAEFQNEWWYRSTTRLDYVSIFAETVKLMGPQSGYQLSLSHGAALDDAVLGPLLEQDALPGPDGTTPVIGTTFGALKARYH